RAAPRSLPHPHLQTRRQTKCPLLTTSFSLGIEPQNKAGSPFMQSHCQVPGEVPHSCSLIVKFQEILYTLLSGHEWAIARAIRSLSIHPPCHPERSSSRPLRATQSKD